MRKEVEYIVSDEGRDKGKTFLIAEMSAYDAERWAWQVVMALAAGGVDVGDIAGAGMEQLAVIGINALFHMPGEESWRLADELMKCVYVLPDPSNPMLRRKLTLDDIEETKTRLILKWEVFKLHTGFSLPGAPSSSTSETPAETSSNTPTPPLPSGRSSPRARRV